MGYIVTATINGRRVESKVFSNKSDAVVFADETRRFRKGSNPRIKKVSKK